MIGEGASGATSSGVNAHWERRRVGKTNLELPAFGFGGATLGDASGAIPETRALATIEAACDAGVAFFDTSPWYGNGKSELRFGSVLRQKPREGYILSTKVGRVYRSCTDPAHPSQTRWRGGLPFCPSFDYRREGVLRSYEQSLLRLGIPRVDALVIHDLDPGHHGSEEAVERRLTELSEEGGYRALTELKDAGEIAAIGAGVNRLGMIPKFLDRFDLDFVLLAMPYTLLNQDALDAELPLCVERGVSVVIGAPFASGILAVGPVREATYGYQAPADEILDRARRIARICDRHATPLGAAALQFPLAHPAVVSVIPGPNHPDQVATNLNWFRHQVPPKLWVDLKEAGLLRPDAPVPLL